jgi:hypothetical protein
MLPKDDMLKKAEDKPASAIWIFPQAIRAPAWLQKLKWVLCQSSICRLFLPCCLAITIYAATEIIHIFVNNNWLVYNATGWFRMQLNDWVFKINDCIAKLIRPWKNKQPWTSDQQILYKKMLTKCFLDLQHVVVQ